MLCQTGRALRGEVEAAIKEREFAENRARSTPGQVLADRIVDAKKTQEQKENELTLHKRNCEMCRD